MSLSIACVTRAEAVVLPLLNDMSQLAKRLKAELVFGADGFNGIGFWDSTKIISVESGGYMEDVQDQVLKECSGDYILRLDDDESVSPIMERWLMDKCYRSADNWQFPRAWLWHNIYHYFPSSPHWPDYQTRLSIKDKAGGRRGLHQASPFGVGQIAPGAILHHKFLIRSREEREALLVHYDKRQFGAGHNFRHFYIPEEFLQATSEWRDNLTAEEALRRAAGMNMIMAQFGEEILPCVEWLLSKGRPARVLEIGTDFGGTAALWCELATEQVISVDLPGAYFGNPTITPAVEKERNDRLKAAYPHFTALSGDSHDPKMVERVKEVITGELDILFIDADHTYEGVKKDYEMYRQFVKPGGVILFHDINESDLIKSMKAAVYIFWGELVGDKREFTIHGDWGGLGALTV